MATIPITQTSNSLPRRVDDMGSVVRSVQGVKISFPFVIPNIQRSYFADPIILRLTIKSLCKHVDTGPRATSKSLFTVQQSISGRLSIICRPPAKHVRYLSKPINVVRSGVDVSTEPQINAVRIKDAKIAVVSQDEDEMQLRVDLNGKETQKVFNQVLTDLARSAPPIPGFRREKGGKTTKVPTEFLLQVLGEERVTKFVIQEIVSSSVAAYVKEENLNVKENKISTTQTAEELAKTFFPGNDFGFNATLEFENIETETETDSSSPSET